ncbi:MAG: aminodeoxychorismate synthase component I [Candidatus Electrothrix sp. AR3]|nr:aminodeoxychorismate synthase component I [Candidatus Electrothrix sp. AR3]
MEGERVSAMKPCNHKTITQLTSWLAGQEDFVFLESAKVNEDDHCSFLFTQPSERLVCLPGDEATVFLDRADRLREQGFFLAGWLGYEFGYLLEPTLHDLLSPQHSPPDQPLATLGVYEEPLIFDHQTGLFNKGNGWPGQTAQEEEFICTALQSSISAQEYLQAIATIQKYIQAGDTYQVNFTLHFDFSFQGSVAALYCALRRNQSVAYSAWIRHDGQDILSFSPELFFRADPTKVRVRPMKGTMQRGRTTHEDEQQQQRLRSDPKNRSENVMIVDLLRNDLARLLHATGGGRVIPQSLFEVEVYESLLQMTSTVDGIPNNTGGLSFRRLIESLFPCGSITGAPKIRTMEIIHELEPQPRGVYCGAIGYTSLEASCFNVPIRTLELKDGQGRMGIGSGIVADSNPNEEWAECLLKGNFLSKNKPDFQLIETMLWHPNEGFFLLDYHLERLADSAHYFHFPCNLEKIQARLLEEMQKKSITDKKTRWRVRLLLYQDGRVEVTSSALPEDTLPLLPKVIFSKQQVDPTDPYLFHKTTRREMYNRERSQAVEQGYYEVLFTNTAGEVTEGTIFNLFLLQEKTKIFLTPPVTCGLLAGTYRRLLLEQGGAVEQVLTYEEVLAAQKVYLVNSVRGIIQIDVIKQ